MNTESMKKYGSLISIVLFALWFQHEPSYEPLIGLLVSIGTFSFSDIKNLLTRSGNKTFQHDKEIYFEIINHFENNGLTYFLGEVDFHNSFSSQMGMDLIVISDGMVEPRYELWNKKLEKTRISLFQKLNEFTHKLAYETYTLNNNRQTAIPDLYRNDMIELPEFIQTRIDELNMLASELLREYTKFYKEGGQKFDQNV